ncbi:MAG: SlyX family protein [Opitutaceae bacterium]
MSEERLLRLEEKIAYLERHVTAQDRAMLELTEELDAFRREVRRLREARAEAGSAPEPAEERPPHY